MSRLGLSPNDKIYQEISKISFWKAPVPKAALEKTNLLISLKAFTELLGLTVTWKLAKDDKAWCYLDASAPFKLKDCSLAPFVIRKATDGRSILLLEHLSTYDLPQIVNDMKTKANIAFNTPNAVQDTRRSAYRI